MGKTIFADESYKKLDKVLSRVTICYVEFRSKDKDSLLESKEQVSSKIIGDKVRFGNNIKKIHYSEFTPAQKAQSCDLISKLKFKCKIFIFYFYNQAETKGGDSKQKLSSVCSSLKFMKDKQIKEGDIIYIEDASIYDSLRNYKNIVITAEHKEMMLIPDIIIGVFNDHLDRHNDQQADSNYKLIKEKIRLQVFNIDGKGQLPLSRNIRV